MLLGSIWESATLPCMNYKTYYTFLFDIGHFSLPNSICSENKYNLFFPPVTETDCLI